MCQPEHLVELQKDTQKGAGQLKEFFDSPLVFGRGLEN